MIAPPRNLPRYLPTLTEIVPSPGLSRESTPDALDADKIEQLVLQRLVLVSARVLQEQLEATVRTLVAEQMPALQARLGHELVSLVRQEVSQAVASVRSSPEQVAPK